MLDLDHDPIDLVSPAIESWKRYSLVSMPKTLCILVTSVLTSPLTTCAPPQRLNMHSLTLPIVLCPDDYITWTLMRYLKMQNIGGGTVKNVPLCNGKVVHHGKCIPERSTYGLKRHLARSCFIIAYIAYA